MIGGTIGSYRLVAKLGEGGMGSVWAAQHTLLGRRAAIKVLLPELSSRADIVERFFNEARASTAIGDLGIVQVFDFGYQDGSAFLVMELLEGESLEARMRRLGALPVQDALRLMRQLAQTLAVVHARGVIHRDLKPDNIFIVADAEAEGRERTKILDFGIAKLSESEGGVSQTRVGSVMGTPLYMSPEQCRGAGKVDHRSDIYSLGCVMFHIICGRPPFDGEGQGEVLVKHITQPPSLPSEIRPGTPAVVDSLIMRCLAKGPDERFADMTEVVRAVAMVQAQLTGNPIAAPDLASHHWRTPTPPPPPPAPTTLSAASGVVTRSPSVSRGRALGAGAGVIAAAAIAIAFVMMRSDPAKGSAGTPRSVDAAVAPLIDAAVMSTVDAHAHDAMTDAANDALVPDAPRLATPVDAGVTSRPPRPQTKTKTPRTPVKEDPYALPK